MSRRLVILALLTTPATLTSACLFHEEEIIPAGEFLVEMDPVAGTAHAIPEVGSTSAGLSVIPVELDGVVGQGAPDTLEATIEFIGRGEAACGVPDSFCVDVMLRSFFTFTRLFNVHVELTRQTPMAGNEILNSDPPVGIFSDYHGLFGYEDLEPAGGIDTATRRWVIRDNDVAMRFRARVLASHF